jgi:hypothetical protein
MQMSDCRKDRYELRIVHRAYVLFAFLWALAVCDRRNARAVTTRRCPRSSVRMIAVALAAVMLGSCASSKKASSKTQPRPARLAVCPKWRTGTALDGFEAVDSRLPSISKQLLGRDVRYRRGVTTVRIVVGLNIEDELEDWDMSGYERRRGSRTMHVFRSGVAPEMRLAVWYEPAASVMCSSLAVVSNGLSEIQLLAVVDALHVDPSA